MDKVARQLWTAPSWAWVLGLFVVGVATADAPPISDPGGNLPTGSEMPGTFPETVTAANVNIAPIAGSELGGSGSDSLLVTVPSGGPIAWTDTRHNEGDVGLAIGPFDPNDPSYYPPETYGEWKPLADGQPFSNATLSWRVNNNHGALLASVRHNGVNNGDNYLGSPVGTTHGVANFIVGGAQGWAFRMNDGEFANGGNGSSDLIMGMAGYDGDNHEASFNVAAASFPYAEGWLGAWVNANTGGEATFAAAHPDVPTSAVNWSNNSARVLLPGVDSASDGMLFVSPSNSESKTKIAGGAPRSGGWDVTIRDDEDADLTGLTPSTDSEFQFLFVPYDANNLIGGHVGGGDGSLINSAGDDRFSVTRSGDGAYALSVFNGPSEPREKLTGDDGMLILSVASHMAGTTDVADRTFLSYEYDAGSGDFMVQSRELAAFDSANSENQFGDWLKLRDSDFYFAFVDFTNPLSLGPVSAPDGDYNDSGLVEQGDLDLVLLHWGNAWPPTVDGWVNDQPEDGKIDQDDLDRVLLNWGSSTPVAEAVAVPEPGGGFMLTLAVVTMLVCSQRRCTSRLERGVHRLNQ